jgi:chromosomal replication initiation ATPase DnaA
LGLALPPRYGSSDFLGSPSNAAALAAITRWPHWPDPVLIVVGPAGSGKTHLSHLWAGRAGARRLDRADLTNLLPEVAAGHGVIDGADDLALPEAEFFHLLNLIRERRSSLLITARKPPDRWSLTTPDLLSRLRLAPCVEIETPDEALVRAVLVKLFDDRQLRVDATLIDYLALRLDRSLAAVGEVVATLDAAGLSSGRRITRTLAATLLGDLHLDAE